MDGVIPPLSHDVIAGSNDFGRDSDDVRAVTVDTSKAAKCDEEYRLCEGVLYFLHTIRFHGTLITVISFTSVRKLRPSLCDFHET